LPGILRAKRRKIHPRSYDERSRGIAHRRYVERRVIPAGMARGERRPYRGD